KLVVISGPDAGLSVDLVVGEHRVGSSSACEIRLRDPAVSRQHLKLDVREDRVIAVDLGSRNGSLCDGRRFSELEVGPGTVLTLGGTELKLLPQESREKPLLLSARTSFGQLYGTSRKMREAFTLLERMAPGGADVLVQGETGTGKELCAEAVHKESPRAQ